MITGNDAGGSGVKICGAFGIKQFPSDLGEYRERNLTNKLNDDELIYEYQGKKGFAGMLARMESEFAGSRKGDTKAHEDAKIRVLLALHGYGDETDHFIVVGQPISTHNSAEKQKIKDMLIGRHELTVNGVRKIFVIRRCEVASEGASVGLLFPGSGLQRIIDIGSGTVNFGTVKNMRFVDLESFTASHSINMENFATSYGIDSIRNLQADAFARMICLKALIKWNKNDLVRVCGGGAETLLPHIKNHFPNAEIVQEPTTANARAFYEIARKLYG